MQKTPSPSPAFIKENIDVIRAMIKEHDQQAKRAKLLRNIKVYEVNKDPEDHLEIHGIKRRQIEGLQAFMDRFESKSPHIKGVPLVLHILAFMHVHDHLKLAKKLNSKRSKTVDEMFERVRAFIKGEVVAKSEGFLLTMGVRQKSCMNIASKSSMLTSGQDSEDVELCWKDWNEKPRSERLYGNADTWKGCKVRGRRCSDVNVKKKCPG
nr:reverse transcriptase domain-containing protein [Tanacetum cinerariifolium]